MPPLGRPERRETIPLEPRSAQVAGHADVLVIGGGPAGIGAAVGAARAGARTILAERYGFLGGNATASLVMPFMSYFTEHATEEVEGSEALLPTDHGAGVPVIAGVFRDFIKELEKAGGAVAASAETGFTVPFDPELCKSIALDFVDEAGVRFLLHVFADSVLGEEGRVEGCVFDSKSGPLAIRANVVIDCTGDGDVAAAAGADFEVGRATDGRVQPMTLMFRVQGFDKEAFERYVHAHPHQWRGVHGLWDLVRQASEAGELDLPREDILFFEAPHAGEITINSTRVTNLFGTDVWDLTEAEWQSRWQMRQIFEFLKKYVPGFERAYIVQSGMNVGVRETRRIVGQYRLTMQDVLHARQFEDVVARCTYPIDIHNPTGQGTTLVRVPPGKAYDIPLRSLLPVKVENLLAAGRCISGTHEACASYRIMPVSMATGHAAGVCAALAARTETRPREVPYRQVQKELLRQGADLRDIQR